ncbi:MAG: cytosol nonspecific dipeptidase [Thermoplasmata archaeon]|nr:MAG: cytosol nonspecific dipeptidase [Thermoplasmata archaeon]
MKSILDLEPKIVWKHFDEIRKIPRCSKHEEKIREHIVNFAKRHNLEYQVDKVGNVVVRKPASKGMEDRPMVVLQSHMDMVCEKNKDVVHDFSKDPIKVKIDGEWVKAEGTTLGADDGIGVATALAILEEKDLKHPPIEALFTVDEETGLTGAFAIEKDFLKGRVMINLDSEDFGVIYIGCAGGGDSTIRLPVKKEAIKGGMEIFEISITGLRGGHSGCDIHEQRGNAIKILARILWKVKKEMRIQILDISGGDKHNAIPREARAVVAVEDGKRFREIVEAESKDILEEIKPVDPNMKVSVTPSKGEESLDIESSGKTIDLLYALPHGVLAMSYDIPDLVETSTNLAKVRLEGDKVVIVMSSRSSSKTELQATRDRIRAIATLAGAEVEEGSSYPGWKPNLDSKILKIAKDVFKELFGKEPEVKAIHAGLETGVIGEKFPGMDMISIGPDVRNPHSPDEKVRIDSVRDFYKYVTKILENIK